MRRHDRRQPGQNHECEERREQRQAHGDRGQQPSQRPAFWLRKRRIDRCGRCGSNDHGKDNEPRNRSGWTWMPPRLMHSYHNVAKLRHFLGVAKQQGFRVKWHRKRQAALSDCGAGDVHCWARGDIETHLKNNVCRRTGRLINPGPKRADIRFTSAFRSRRLDRPLSGISFRCGKPEYRGRGFSCATYYG